jgi:transcriptional regulator with XRE-family HTH domain
MQPLAKIDKTQRPAFAKNISARRKTLGLSQTDLADRIGTHRNTIADIERGTSEGRPDTKQAIASALGCSIGDLYSETSLPKLSPELIAAVRDAAHEIANSNQYSGLSKDKQKLIALIASDGVDDATIRILLGYINVETPAVFRDENQPPVRKKR